MRILALVATLTLFVQVSPYEPKQGPGAEPGKPAPDWKLKSQDGKQEIQLSALKGKPVLLVFGSWT